MNMFCTSFGGGGGGGENFFSSVSGQKTGGCGEREHALVAFAKLLLASVGGGH
jgi:hypothetical protein